MSATTMVSAPISAPRSNTPSSDRNTPRPQSAGLKSASPKFAGPNRNFNRGGPPKEKREPKTLFQKYFKSVGPRTYAAQVKEAGNGNHFFVLTEGKRDQKTNELKKLSLFVFSEDFEQFKILLRDTFKFITDHPMPVDVQKKREKFWQKQKNGTAKWNRR